jgi:hypothetical protein
MWWIALAGIIPSLLALAVGEFFRDLQNLCDDWDDRDSLEAIWYGKEGTRIKTGSSSSAVSRREMGQPRGFPSPFCCTPRTPTR